jgi:hypothetical protein
MKGAHRLDRLQSSLLLAQAGIHNQHLEEVNITRHTIEAPFGLGRAPALATVGSRAGLCCSARAFGSPPAPG